MQDEAVEQAVAVFTSRQEESDKTFAEGKGHSSAFPSSYSHSYHTSEEHTALKRPLK